MKGNTQFDTLGKIIIRFSPVALALGLLLYPQVTLRILGAFWDRLWEMIPSPSVSSPSGIPGVNLSGVMDGIQVVAWTGLGIGLALLTYYLIYNYRNTCYAEILPSASLRLQPGKILTFNSQVQGLKRPWYKRLTRGRESFDFFTRDEVVERNPDGTSKSRKIVFYIRYPRDRQTGLKKAIQTNFPGTEIREITREEFNLKVEAGYGGRLVKTGEHPAYPVKQFAKESDLADILHNLGESGMFMVRLVPVNRGKVNRLVKSALKKNKYKVKDLMFIFGNSEAAKVRRDDMSPDQRAKLESLYKLYTGRETYFQVSAYIWSQNPVKEFRESDAQAFAVKIGTTLRFDAGMRMKRLLVLRKLRMMLYLNTPIPLPHHGVLMNTAETANLIHYPPIGKLLEEEPPHLITQRVLHLQEGSRWLEEGELDTGTPIGVSMHPRQRERRVYIDDEQMTKHFFLSGQTGSGKSSTLVEMLQGDIDRWMVDENAPGFTVIDPAEDLSANLLSRIKRSCEQAGRDWNEVAKRVVYFPLGSTPLPVGLNMLHVPEGTDIDTVTKNTMDLIKYASENKDTPQMDRFLEPTLKTLLMVPDQKHSILGIQKMLEDKDFRDGVVPKISHHPILRDFWRNWEEMLENNRGLGKLDSLINRLSPFRTTDVMRRMVGQLKWSLDIRRYMDQGYLVVINAKGIPTANFKLLGGLLITHYHWTAQRRPVGSRLHKLIIDECHLLQIPVMEKIIAEDRKFGLSLGLSTQYLDQLSDWLVKAIDGNVGTILSCTQGNKGAKAVEAITNGAFSVNTLRTLPERTVAVYSKRKVEERSEPITAIVQSDIPYLYDQKGDVADYEDKKKFQGTIDWMLKELGGSLQEKVGTSIEEVDAEMNWYMEGKFREESEEKQETKKKPSAVSKYADKLQRLKQLKQG